MRAYVDPLLSRSGNQNLHLASAFDLYHQVYNKIIGMAWRPDESVNEPITINERIR